MKMPKVFIVLGLLLSASVARADEDTTKSEVVRLSEIKSKSWFLQFSVTNGIFTSSGLDGGSLTIRHHLSPRHAIRFGASFPLRVGSTESTTIDDNRYGFQMNSSEQGDNSVNITLSLRTIWYRKSGKNLHPYFGIGPSYRFGFSEYDYPSGSTSESRRESSFSALSMNGILGSEIFLMDGFSLFGEVSLGLEYRSQREEYESIYYSSQGSDYHYQERESNYFSVIHEVARMGFSLQL